MPRLTVRTAPDHDDHAQGERAIDVDAGAVLLDALTRAGVRVQTLCGGALECRTCVVFVSGDDDAASPCGVKERLLLRAKNERAPIDLTRARFACQVRVKGALTVVVPRPAGRDDDDDEVLP